MKVLAEARTPRKNSFEIWRERWSQQVCADKKLPGGAKAIAWRLTSHLNRKSHTAWPSICLLAKQTGMSEYNALKCIKKLIARGHLKIVAKVRRGRFYHNVYTPVLGTYSFARLTNSHPTAGRIHTQLQDTFTPNPSWVEPLTEPLNRTFESDFVAGSVVVVADAPTTSPSQEGKMQEESEEKGWAEKQASESELATKPRTYGLEDLRELLKSNKPGSTATHVPLGRHLSLAEALKMNRAAPAAKLNRHAAQGGNDAKLNGECAPTLS